MNTFSTSHPLLIGDDWTMETLVRLSLLKSPQNIATLATDKLIELLVNSPIYPSDFCETIKEAGYSLPSIYYELFIAPQHKITACFMKLLQMQTGIPSKSLSCYFRIHKFLDTSK